MNDEARLMGIDHGRKRIGVALSDPLGIIASPLTVVDGSSWKRANATLGALVTEHGVRKIVVGLPTDSEGGIGSQARTVIRWARLLEEVVATPVVLWDESHSTEDAVAHTQHGKRRRDLDAVAAAVILQSYLEARRTTHEPGQPLQAYDDETVE